MRPTTRVLVSLATLFLCVSTIFSQTNPPPSYPHELVTREPRTLSKAADRSVALDVLNRARQNFNLHDISVPYTLRVSFQTNGATANEGEGKMEELSDGGSHWRWTAELPNSQVIRIGTDGHVYGTNPAEPVPLRVQMIRAALHWPILRNAGASVMRTGDVTRDGKTLSCLLLSASIPENPAPRGWLEVEYCIDSATGLLQMWSEAPGIYAEYDYTGAVEFHGHTLPQTISIFEDGRLAAQARVESIEDAPRIEPSLFKPTPEMMEAGGSFMLAAPNRFLMRIDPSDAPTSTFFQPVIVHATLDAQDGRVLDAETLQNSDAELSRAAMELVRSSSYAPSGFQQEVFFNVQFHIPAMLAGGPPVFHSGVRWVIWHEHRTPPPVHKPPHVGN